VRIVSILLLLLVLPVGANALSPQYQNMVNDIIGVFATGQKEKIADLFVYPIPMQYPNPDILTEEELIRRFDEVFDDKLLNDISASDASDDKVWSAVGWRGIMFYGGDVWINYEGKIIKVNYVTTTQQEKVAQLISLQKETLHVDLKSFLRPIFEDDIGQYHIRIDLMEGHSYRYASWSKGKRISQKPDIIVMNGTITYEGTGGDLYYKFLNGSYEYRFSVFYVGTEDTPPGRLVVLKNGNLILSNDWSGKNNR